MLKKGLQSTELANNSALQMKKRGLEVTKSVSKRARIQVPSQVSMPSNFIQQTFIVWLLSPRKVVKLCGVQG